MDGVILPFPAREPPDEEGEDERAERLAEQAEQKANLPTVGQRIMLSEFQEREVESLIQALTAMRTITDPALMTDAATAVIHAVEQWSEDLWGAT